MNLDPGSHVVIFRKAGDPLCFGAGTTNLMASVGDRAAVPKMRGREENKRDKPLQEGKLSI